MDELQQRVQDALQKARAAADAEAKRIQDAVAGAKADYESARADRKKAEQSKNDATRAAIAYRIDSAIKTEARAAFIAAGGLEAEFEQRWPDLKAQIIQARTVAGVNGQQTRRISPNARL